MELRHLRYFIAVAQALHFTRAAGRLGISTPTLTRQIQDMETELGARLLERNQRSVALTPAGQVFLAESLEVIARFEAAQMRAQRTARGETGRINIGYVGSAVYSGVLQRQIADFRETSPDVRVMVREEVMSSLPGLVLEGQIDVAYLRSPMVMPDGVESIRLAPERFILALPGNSWLLELPTIASGQLVDEIFILPEQPSGTLSVAELGGFTPRLGPQPGSLVAVLTLVSLGEGVAVVPASVAGHIALPNLAYRDIANFSMASYLSLVYRRYESTTVLKRYIDLVARSRVNG